MPLDSASRRIPRPQLHDSFPAYPTPLFHNFGVVCATVSVIVFLCVLATCLTSLGFPSYAWTRGLTLACQVAIIRPPLPLHPSALLLFYYFLSFRPVVPRHPSRSNLADPHNICRQCALYCCFKLLLFCLSIRLLAFSRTGSFSLTVQPIAPRQPSMSNVVDSDNILGSVPRFLSCLSANSPTARPYGPALQALNLSGLHSVTRVPFFPSDIVSTCFHSHPCAQWPRPSCFRSPIATGIP